MNNLIAIDMAKKLQEDLEKFYLDQDTAISELKKALKELQKFYEEVELKLRGIEDFEHTGASEVNEYLK